MLSGRKSIVSFARVERLGLEEHGVDVVVPAVDDDREEVIPALVISHAPPKRELIPSPGGELTERLVGSMGRRNIFCFTS